MSHESDRDESDHNRLSEQGLDVEGGGQSAGRPNAGADEGGSYTPSGGVQEHHWRESFITEPGLDRRGNVFFAAVEMTRMPMVVTDPNLPDNPIVFVNGAFLDLTGYTEEEIVGRNCRFLQGPQTDRETVREVREALEAHQAISVEILNYRRDGSPFWNALFIGPIFDSAGKLLYFFASQLDITRRRSSEQAFRQAQKMEAIGQLTAGLAHDFNNLLQVVTGNLEIAAGLAENPRQQRALENAERAAKRGEKLTKQLLAFARKTRLEPKATNLNGLVLEFSDMLARTLGERVDLRLDLKPRLPACSIDPIHLEMALLNVLLNARDAMPGGGAVTIGTGVVHLNGDAVIHNLPSGDYVELSVRDEGEGMPAHVIERATEPFFTTKGPAKGTGLGLAMVHGFVQQSRGRLQIDSQVGAGTTIRMIFPISSERATGGPERAPTPQLDAAPATGTILAVDDSDDVLALAQDHLETLGYQVIPARSGEEALSILERGTPVDLLFTDLVMPGGMTGLDLAERAAALRPGLPVLMTTGYNDELVVEGPRRPDMDVLGKPYRRSELADRVRAALGRKAGGERRSRIPGHKEG